MTYLLNIEECYFKTRSNNIFKNKGKLTNLVYKIEEKLDIFIKTLLTVLVFLIFLITLAQVLNRFFFNRSIVWVEIIAKYLFIWVVFTGIAYGIKIKSHFKMTEVLEKFPKKIQYLIISISNFIIIILFIVILLSSIPLLKSSIKRIAFGTNILMFYFYLVIPVGSFLSIFYYVLRIIKNNKMKDSKGIK